MESVKELATLALATSLLVSKVSAMDSDSKSTTALPLYNETVYIYLLMVPDYDLKRLQTQRFRQDEEDGPISFAQTGVAIGQIIQGVLGGDTRQVFSGSLKFVEEPTAQLNLGTFLGTIAPGLNLIIREFYTRAQTAFGLTPKPGPAVVPEGINEDHKNVNKTSNANNTIVPYNFEDTSNSTLSVQEQLRNPVPTTSWEYVLNQLYRETTTTVQPLPFIRLRTTTVDEYYDEI